MPVRSVFYNDSTDEVYQYSLSYSGYESNEDVVQAIKDQTQHFEDSFGGAVNPGQAGANQEIQDNVGQLEDFDNKIFTDVSDYTSQLDFGPWRLVGSRCGYFIYRQYFYADMGIIAPHKLLFCLLWSACVF